MKHGKDGGLKKYTRKIFSTALRSYLEPNLAEGEAEEQPPVPRYRPQPVQHNQNSNNFSYNKSLIAGMLDGVIHPPDQPEPYHAVVGPQPVPLVANYSNHQAVRSNFRQLPPAEPT